MSDSEEFRRQTDKDIAHLTAKLDQMEKRDESIIEWMRTIDGKMDLVNANLGRGATEFATHSLRLVTLEKQVAVLEPLPAEVDALKAQSKSVMEWLKMPVTGVVSAAGAFIAAKLFGGNHL